MKRPLPNTYWVIPGRFLAGEYPGSDDPAVTQQRVASLAGAGIDAFFDLTEPEELEPYRDALPAGVEYHSVPLIDHGVPANQAQMRDIQAVLGRALRQGRNVYVHCRAGIGRTGMTVACYLSDEGRLDGETALARLNELWKQNARSKRWPSVPETQEQVEFVRRWRKATPTTVAAPAVNASSRIAMPSLAQRFRGALLGLAVGDALAVASQGLERGTFAPITGPRGGGADDLPPGAWTDDTAMALCSAESLLERGGFDVRDQMQRYRLWQQEGHLSSTGVAVGLRPTVRRAVALAGFRRAPVVGSHDPTQLDSEPLVRCVTPALFFFGDEPNALEAGADTARVTHQAPLVVDSCRLFTALLHATLEGAGKVAIATVAAEWSATPLKQEVLDVAAGWVRTSPASRRGPPTILTTLDLVVRTFLSSRDFAVGALELANLGGDSDIAASAYGQLAGAYYGEEGIPALWRGQLLEAALIRGFADRLLDAGTAVE